MRRFLEIRGARAIWGTFLGLIFIHPPVLAADLTLIYRSDQGAKPLKTYTPADLKRLKRTSLSEKKVQWGGVRLDALILDALQGLTAPETARIDLLVLVTSTGSRIQIPKSFAMKYPVLLADTRAGGALTEFSSVLPFSSSVDGPKMTAEKLPHERYALSGVHEIWLMNYRDFYGPLLLTKRTDPLQLRGEKLFVQSCMGCHAKTAKWDASKGPLEPFQPSLAMPTHPPVSGVPALSERDRRALEAYFRSQTPNK